LNSRFFFNIIVRLFTHALKKDNLKNKIKSILKKIPFFGKVYRDYVLLNENSCHPPGHFYSPIINVQDVKKRANEIWAKVDKKSIQGVNLNVEGQLNLLADFAEYYADLPFEDMKSEKLRYYYDNPYYGYTDAIVLYSMMRKFKPKRIVEVGSGFSSAVMLDTNEMFFNNAIQLTFIEPFPDRLNSLLRKGDRDSVKVVESIVQTVDLEIFKRLEVGDFLFIDSSHVSKTDSDLNHLMFEVLPILKPGVIIHFHDVFYPFEYPKNWVFSGRNWNEDYILHTFMMYNSSFSILLFADYLHRHHQDAFAEMPLLFKNTGACMWIKKEN